MFSRTLPLLALLFLATSPSFADDAKPIDETPAQLRAFVASFNLARPKDFEPLLVEDVLCSKELSAELHPLGDAFPSFPDAHLSKEEFAIQDKVRLRAFRQTLASVVARRKAPDVKAMASASTRFGPTFRELGHNILTAIADIDTALKIEVPGAYLRAALRVREDVGQFAPTYEHSSRAFAHLAYEYRTIEALAHGKPRPVWKEPESHVPQKDLNSPLDLQVN